MKITKWVCDGECCKATAYGPSLPDTWCEPSCNGMLVGHFCPACSKSLDVFAALKRRAEQRFATPHVEGETP